MTNVDVGRVLISGGASGLGAAIARCVLAHGGTPAIIDVHKLPDDILHEIADVSDHQAVGGAVQRIADHLGGLDAVITAAGIDRCGPLEAVDADQWNKVIAVNLIGTAAVIRAALPALKQSRGRIVTVASTLGLRAVPDATAYCASKFAVVGFTRALAAELSGEVGVTLLVPGGMQTQFFDDRDEKYKPGSDAVLNDPGNVAQAAVWALSQPFGCEVRELAIMPSTEPSWP